ncbi:PAZ domain-containing protein [Ditylenchus destructor]|uniref:PAZ domain-containing protein n=1 Tax=Ditylenchus destructor TaxID=166010 RepID=A0AAD4MNE2_9BILA|nr:PAZ domain-containing protein [Ditylenchus destructor]
MAQQTDIQQGKLVETELPEKLLNERGIRNVEEAKILLNAHRLDLSKAVKKVYKYELKFVGRIPPETEKDLSRGPKNDVANQTRRQLLWEMYMQMLSSNPNTFGDKSDFRNYLYDCGINFYSNTSLNMVMGEVRIFPIDRTLLPADLHGYLGRRVEKITANLLYCEEIDLRELGKLSESRSRSAVQFLDILSSQEIIKKNRHYIFPPKVFEKANEIRLKNDPRILKEGFEKNVRIVGDNLEDATPIIQIDHKMSAFFPEVTVDEFLSKFLTGHEPDLGRRIFSQMHTATKQIKGLSVVATHLEVPRTFTVYGLTPVAAKEITFDLPDGAHISVVDYIERRYNRRIRHPNLPCVIENIGSKKVIKKSFYPIELVKIVAGQRVNFDQQTPGLLDKITALKDRRTFLKLIMR